ncbi:hypothetical protein STEG23_031967, partial [Scotinomys teguina]
MAPMLLPGMKVSQLLVQRTVTRTIGKVPLVEKSVWSSKDIWLHPYQKLIVSIDLGLLKFLLDVHLAGVYTVEGREMEVVKPETLSIFLSVKLDLTSDRIYESSCALRADRG